MTDPVLQVHGLCKNFGAVVACEDVSIELHTGEIHALIGPNGAGKSTLIKQIAGELKQDAGQISFCGKDVSKLDVVGRTKAGLARSFQVSSIIPEFTVLQNTMLAVQGNSGRSYRFFKSVLQDVELRDNAQKYLAHVGMDARAAIVASELSHGERRKLEIAMALALEPKAFLLDEPMAGMGASGSKALTKMLQQLKSQAPILLVEHDMDAVFALADRISVLVYGRIIATGTAENIRNNKAVREAYLGSDDA